MPSVVGPVTLRPSVARIPVASMSMRPRMGIVHEFARPGNFRAWSMAAINSSVVLRPEPGRVGHCSRGFSTTSVSNIESGAGSVAVEARPALPNTDATSGKLFRIRSVLWSRRDASAIEIPGRVEGM